MILNEKIASISKTSILKPMNPAKFVDLDNFWEIFVEPLLPEEHIVREWHKILKDYVNKPDAVFFMRAFGSHTKKETSEVLRRGFYNITNHKFSAFYVDNFFTAYFYSTVFDGFVPRDINGINEFETMMRDRSFPCGCIQTTAEKKYATYFRGTNPGISAKGYKIAHIYSSGENFSKKAGYSTIGDFCSKEFPRGLNTDWDNLATDIYGNYYYRQVDLSDPTKARKFLVAHFIRTVHPINYFLVPKEGSVCWKDIGGVEHYEIGENEDLIKYAAAKMKNKYSDIYDEFLDMIYPDKLYSAISKNQAMDIECQIDKWKTKGLKYSEVQIIDLIEDYLFNGAIYKTLEEKHLGKKSNGSQTLSVLRAMGVEQHGVKQHNKGVFKGMTVYEAIDSANEELGEILEQIVVRKGKNSKLLIVNDILGHIGKKIFIDYYDDFKNCTDKNTLAVKLFDENENASSIKAQITRINKAREIFDNGLEKEALEIIIDSKRLDTETVQRAKAIYQR